jgi:hypothetical protein
MANSSHARPFILVSFVMLVFSVLSWAQTPKQAAPPAGSRPHRATLNWAPSPDAKKAGSKLKYAIYRSEGIRNPDGKPECVGNFDKIAEVEGAKTTFIDPAVKANHVYCYKLKSVIDKMDGPFSAVIVAAIPSDK